MPELEDESYKRQLWHRLQQLREEWYREEQVITSGEVQQAYNLSLCFGGKWVVPVMLWALATRARPEQDQLLTRAFRDDFYGELNIHTYAKLLNRCQELSLRRFCSGTESLQPLLRYGRSWNGKS